MARSRLLASRAAARQASSALWPTIDLTAFRARARQLRNTATPNRIVDADGVDLEASWELDVLGGNRSRARAARLESAAAAAGLGEVTTALVAEVTAAYLELAGVDERLAVLDENIAVQEEGARLAKGAFAAGLAIELTVERATARLAATQAGRPLLEQARMALIDRLAVLAGDTPEQLLHQYTSRLHLPAAVPTDPHLAPSELLLRRPDVRAAQDRLLAAAARARAARTALLPRFFISGSYGLETLSPAQLPGFTDPVYFLGASVAQSIFSAGRLRAQVAFEDARFDAAAAGYDKAVLQALADVEDAYAAVQAGQTARAHFAVAAQAAAAAETQARTAYRLGRVDYTTLLDTQRERLLAEDGLIQARTATAVAYTSLFRAFGGGWQ
jgi:NodT family efflux transporter outer membrane factor (OMF) lipoprotein